MILALILAIEVRIEEAVTRTYRLHSSMSRSEKAVPVLRDGEVVAVLDIEGRQMEHLMKPTGEALKDNETDTINVCSCRQQRRCHRTGRCPHWPFRGRHLKRMLIWSFTDSLEQDTCSNYQKVRYVCKCLMRKMSFMQTAVLPFT